MQQETGSVSCASGGAAATSSGIHYLFYLLIGKELFDLNVARAVEIFAVHELHEQCECLHIPACLL
jgi:hypothetical protein